MDRVAATAAVPCDIRDLTLADAGRRRIEWATSTMPVLRAVRKQFIKTQPFAGLRIAALLRCTPETANLLITLRDGGAQPVLCGASPVSTQDDVAAALVRDFHIPVFALRGDTADVSGQHLAAAVATQPHLVVDTDAVLSSRFLGSANGVAGSELFGVLEETTAGVNQLRRLLRDSSGPPIAGIAAGESSIRRLFDNRYGTGQSALDSLIRLTDLLIAGMTVVVAGYGQCGRGIAERAQGLGARVIVTETNPSRALEAAMAGFRVVPMAEAAPMGDVLICATGNRNVIGRDTFDRLKDGAILCNAGYSDVEIELAALKRLSASKREARENVEEYKMKDGRRIWVLAGGRVLNLAAAEGHPVSVKDIGLSTEALSAEHLVRNRQSLSRGVYAVPADIDRLVARMKLDSMGVSIDKLTIEQEQYLGRSEDNKTRQ